MSGRRTPPRASAKEVESFLRTVWGSTANLRELGGRVAIFTLPESQSETFDSVEEAAKAAAKFSSNGLEVYVRISALRPDFPASSKKRGGEEDAVLLPALVIDLDLQLPDRRKRRLFESLEEAQDLLDKLPLKPTLTVGSGGGLQAWWILSEPLDLIPEGARARAAKLSRGWHETVLSQAEKIGRTIDSTWDLSRVMRLPGTLNRKRESVAQVEILDGPHEKLRYSLDDIESHSLSESHWGGSVAISATVDGLALRPLANPPTEKFDSLMEFDPKFKSSWNHRRKDLQDDSLSGYDMSLASIAVRTGWSDQEVCDLLIAHRRKYEGDLKLRERYYSGTIANAKKGVEVDSIASEVVAAGGVVAPGDDDARSKVLRMFSSLTGAPLERVIVYEPEGTQLTFKFCDGRQFHCTQDDFADWLRFWKRLVASGFSPRPQRQKQSVWLALVASVYGIADRELVESSGEASRVATFCVELARESGVRLSASEESNARERAAAIQNHGAFIWKSRLWVRLSGLARVAAERRAEKGLQSEARLRAVLVEELGAEKRIQNASIRTKARKSGEKIVEESNRQVGGTCYGIEVARLRAAVDEDEREEVADNDE